MVGSFKEHFTQSTPPGSEKMLNLKIFYPLRIFGELYILLLYLKAGLFNTSENEAYLLLIILKCLLSGLLSGPHPTSLGSKYKHHLHLKFLKKNIF